MDPAAIKKISIKAHFFLGLIIATCVCVGVWIMGLIGWHATWPAFFVMISFFITGADVKLIPSILASAILGLVIALVFFLTNAAFVAALGPLMGILIPVWVIVFAIAFLGDPHLMPKLFNNYAFIFFTAALMLAGELGAGAAEAGKAAGEAAGAAAVAAGNAANAAALGQAAGQSAASSFLVSHFVTFGLTAVLGGGGVLLAILTLISLARKAGLIPPADAAAH